MKITPSGRIICEQCGGRSEPPDSRNSLKDIMRSACLEQDWGYCWDGVSQFLFFCPRCKLDQNDESVERKKNG
jgi:hypothetical protein